MTETKRRRHGGLLRRVGAWALSFAMGLSMMSGALPMTAHAADVDTLTIQLRDRELYEANLGGTDAQGLARLESRQILYHDVTELYKMIPVATYIPVERRTIQNSDGTVSYVYISQSTGASLRADDCWARNPVNGLYRYVTQEEFDTGGSFYEETVTYEHWSGMIGSSLHSYTACWDSDIGRWSWSCIQNHASNGKSLNARELPVGSEHTSNGTYLKYTGGADLEAGHIYIITEGPNISKSAYCYVPDSYDGVSGFFQLFKWGSGPLSFMGETVNIRDGVCEPDIARNDPREEAVDSFANPSSAGSQSITMTNNVMRGGFSFSVIDAETGLSDLQTMAMPWGSVFAVFNISGTAIATNGYQDLQQIDGHSDTANYPVPKNDYTSNAATGYGKALIYHDWRGAAGIVEQKAYYSEAYTYDEVMQAYNAYLTASKNAVFVSDGANSDLDVLEHLPAGYELRHYTGLYGYKDPNNKYNYEPLQNLKNTDGSQLTRRLDYSFGYDSTSGSSWIDVCSGLFDLNGGNGGKQIIPCAMLVTDTSGAVHTGAAALPAGNYLVLQVRSPAGYYIDENFRLGVAIGPWYYDWDLDVTSTDPFKSAGSGYGNALFKQFAYTTRDTSYLCRSENHFNGSPLKNAYITTSGYPCVYINAADIANAMESVISAATCSDFFVTSIGGVGMSLDESENVTYRKGSNPNGAPAGLGNKGEYVFENTMTGKANANALVGVRRYPDIGDSRLVSRLTPVRAGVSFRLADADKIAAYKKGQIKNIQDIWAPQGDATLAGATFNLYHDAATGNESLGAYIENGRVRGNLVLAGRDYVNTHGFTSILGLASSYDGITALTNNHDTGGWPGGAHKTYYSQMLSSGGYVVNIPIDELPYGEYTLIETGGEEGNGYGGDETWAAHLHEEISPNILRVVGEDQVFIGWGGKNYNSPLDASKIQDVLDDYTIGGQIYLPQSVYRAKADVSVAVRGEADNKSVTAHLKIYNISENSVVLNPGANEIVVGTAKKAYDAAGVSGTVTMEQAASITSGAAWTSALLWEGDVKSGSNVTSEVLNSLPYGTYLVVTTKASGDYAPVNGAFEIFTIRTGELASAAVILADKATVPQISGNLVDAANGTKTLRVDMDVTATDTLELTNLQAGVPYVVYGVLLDASNMMMIAGPESATVAAFIPAGWDDLQNSKADSAILGSWITTGDALNTSGRKDTDGSTTYWKVVSGSMVPYDGYSDWVENYTTWAKAIAANAGSLHCSAADSAAIIELANSLSDARTMNKARHAELMGKLRALYNMADDSYLTGSDTAVLTFQHIDTRGMEGKIVTACIFVCEGESADKAVLEAKDIPAMRRAMGDTLRAEYSGRSASVVNATASYATNVSAIAAHAGSANYGSNNAIPMAHAYPNLLSAMLASTTTPSGSTAGGQPEDENISSGTGSNTGSGTTGDQDSGSVSAKTQSQEATVVNLKIAAYGMPGGTSTKTITAGGYVMAQVDLSAAESGGTYKIIGTLKDEAGMAVTKADGTSFSTEKQFTYTGGTHSETISFEGMDASKYDGKRLTVYVDLYRISTTGDADGTYFIVTKGDETKSTGNNPGANQVDVKGPTVETTLTDPNGKKTADLKQSNARLRDRVVYTGLTPGVRYESVLTLMYPNGNEVLDYSGKAVTATATFTARSASSTSTDINVTFDGRNLSDKTVIAFNDLYVLGSGNSKTLVASEHDLESAAQTVTDEAPAGRVYLSGEVKDDTTHTHYTQLAASVAATDAITIQGLDAGKSYQLKLTAAEAGNGAEIANFQAVTSNITANDNGNWSGNVGLTLNTLMMSGKSIVIYLRLYSDDGIDLVAEHAVASDTAQTLYVPGMNTFATGADGASKTIAPVQKEDQDVSVKVDPNTGETTTDSTSTFSYQATIRDKVDYMNLVPGNPYVISTEVVPKAGGAALESVETKFTPSSASGTTYIDITVDVTNSMNQDVVVTQTITDTATSKVVLVHDDLNDANQTVHIGMPGDGSGTPGSGDPLDWDSDPNYPGGTGDPGVTGSGAYYGKDIQTGITERYGLFIGLGVASMLAAAGCVVYIVIRKRKEQERS